MTGEELKTLRQIAGYSQKELANALHVHRVTVCRWESGKIPISDAMALLITKILLQPKL